MGTSYLREKVIPSQSSSFSSIFKILVYLSQKYQGRIPGISISTQIQIRSFSPFLMQCSVGFCMVLPFLFKFFIQNKTKFPLAPMGGSPNFFCIGILLFLLLRSPCKISNSYDMPLLGFSNGGKKKENMQNSGLRLSDTVCTAPLGPKLVYTTIGFRLATLSFYSIPVCLD